MIDEGVMRNRLRLLPPIRRARLWRLYAEARPAGLPSRFLDFWMDGGRSILGAKGTGIGTVAKAAIDTGLTRPFPSIREGRLAGELLRRYPGYAAVRFFRDEGRAIAAAGTFLGEGEALRILRPFIEHLEPGRLDAGPVGGAMSDRVAMPILPCPAALSPAALLFKDPGEAEASPGELIPPLGLACAHRALCELDRFAAEYDESLWRRVDRRLAPYFERRGPYLFARAQFASSESGYDRLFRTALGAGVLLSPDPSQPSIVPGDFDDGELARMAAALATL
jgi:hypothetical protein